MIRTTATCVLVVFVLSGCSMWRGPQPPPDLSSVAISTTGEPDLDLHAKTTARRILVGTGGGLVAGATAGAVGAFATTMVVGAATGPAFPIVAGIGIAFFVPAAAVGGGIVGMVVGGTTGAIVGGLPGKTADEVNAILGDPNSLRDFTKDLGVAVQSKLPEAQQADRTSALTLVTVELTEVELTQYRSDSLAIKMKASAKYSWGHIRHSGHRRTQKDPTTATCTYEYETPKAHVDEWLVDEGKPFELAFEDAINGIARQVAQDMHTDLPPPEDAGSSLLGVQTKKLPSGDYELTRETAEDAEARQSAACLKKLRSAR